MNTKISFIDC